MLKARICGLSSEDIVNALVSTLSALTLAYVALLSVLDKEVKIFIINVLQSLTMRFTFRHFRQDANI